MLVLSLLVDGLRPMPPSTEAQTLPEQWVRYFCNFYYSKFSRARVELSRVLKNKIFVLCVGQGVLVDTATCIHRDMEQGQQHWALHCSTTEHRVGSASRLCVITMLTLSGARRGCPSPSPPQISALPTTISRAITAAGATRLASTSTWRSPLGRRSASTEAALSPSSTRGTY